MNPGPTSIRFQACRAFVGRGDPDERTPWFVAARSWRDPERHLFYRVFDFRDHARLSRLWGAISVSRMLEAITDLTFPLPRPIAINDAGDCWT